ncbi:MAG: ribonuclease H-like domain-containing protein [Caldilineaceae bacterium]|nr:ribonuclease H-like domain-containing protein [Caldilineaceae bacterium]
MTSQLERLRRLQGMRRRKTQEEPSLPPPGVRGTPASDAPLTLEEAAAGEEVENHAGACYVVTRRYSLGDAHGPRPLGALLEQTPGALAARYPAFRLGKGSDFLNAAFIDTETTGLGGGAGVYAFMVGVGTFEARSPAFARSDLSQKINPNNPNPALRHAGDGGGEAGSLSLAGSDQNAKNPLFPADGMEFVVRQFFMRTPAEEGALLVALGELLQEQEMTVTFNGRTFDLPLLRTRLQMNHWLFPAGLDEFVLLQGERAHLDLLHPSRRLWRRRLGSCRLINLEERVLGLRRSEEDVPGALIPQLYIDYTRSGDARQMGRIFYHNREDIVSMVALADVLSRTYALQPSQAPAQALPGPDWLALGDMLEREANLAEAERAYVYAAEHTALPGARGDAYARLGQLLKRQGRWEEASHVWQQWLTTVPDADLTPYVELAKYCEWQRKDLEQAEMWAGWALHTLESARPGRHAPGARGELAHRLARIRRKRNGVDA